MKCLAGPPRAHRPGALEQIAEWWQHMKKSWLHTDSPQTRHQRTFVRRWAEPPPGLASIAAPEGRQWAR